MLDLQIPGEVRHNNISSFIVELLDETIMAPSSGHVLVPKAVKAFK